MNKDTRFVGLDVHAETIAVAVAEPEGEVRSVGMIPNRPESLRRLLRKLGPPEKLRVCYEAGPCGYVVYGLLEEMGIHCDVVAPTLVPVRSGDRVKTDRRDAAKLARSYRSGDLTAVWVPDAAQEALRDLVRGREAAKKDQLRARHRLGKFLLRHGRRPPEGTRPWTQKHERWLRGVGFELAPQHAVLKDYRTEVEHQAGRVKALEVQMEEAVEMAPAPHRAVVQALQALRGVKMVTALTVITEVGTLSRFRRARELMGYGGIVPREHSSGGRRSRGPITKTGNAHLRRVLGEAAWPYRYKPAICRELARRQEGVCEEVKGLCWKAQLRLHHKFWRLTQRGKPVQQAVTAVARELLGFIWAIGVHVEQASCCAQRRGATAAA